MAGRYIGIDKAYGALAREYPVTPTPARTKPELA